MNLKMNDVTEEEIREGFMKYCKQMRLSSGFAQRAFDQGDYSCHLYLYGLLHTEFLYRKEKKARKDTEAAGFPRRYRLEEFDSSQVKVKFKSNDTTLEHLTSLDFYEHRENVVMYGNSGTGKTMLAIILGQLLAEKGATVYFFRVSSLIEQLCENKAGGTLKKFKDKMKKASVFILDEFAYVPYSLEGMHLLFDFVSDIYMNKSIILTTNLEFANWGNAIPDPKLTASFVGRITEDANIVLFPGKDMRWAKKQSQK